MKVVSHRRRFWVPPVLVMPWRNVLVAPEQVVRVVFGLDVYEPFPRTRGVGITKAVARPRLRGS